MSRSVLGATVMLGVLCLVGLYLSSCSSPMHYKDGKLFFINNTRPWREEERVYAIFEERETPVPFNMTVDGELTGVGAIPLTEEPLAGGTEVTVTCKFQQQGASTFYSEITLTMDGNMTVEAHEVDWDTSQSMITLRVHRGIYNGGDPAAGGGG